MKRVIVENGKRKTITKPTFKKLWGGDKITRLVGVHDALMSQIVQDAGFEGLWLSSFELHASARLPDADILTVKDYADAISKIADRVNIPILVDGDCGGGSPINTIRMVREYDKAGASGICLEDAQYPKRCALYDRKVRLASPSQHAQKIRAAKENRINRDFVVVARVEALIAGATVATAVARAKAYIDAGADAILIHCKDKEPDRVFEAASHITCVPVVVVPTMYPDVTERELYAEGIRCVIYANCGIRAQVCIMEVIMKRLAFSRGLYSLHDHIVPLQEIYDLVGVKDLNENERRYSTRM